MDYVEHVKAHVIQCQVHSYCSLNIVVPPLWVANILTDMEGLPTNQNHWSSMAGIYVASTILSLSIHLLF